VAAVAEVRTAHSVGMEAHIVGNSAHFVSIVQDLWEIAAVVVAAVLAALVVPTVGSMVALVVGTADTALLSWVVNADHSGR